MAQLILTIPAGMAPVAWEPVTFVTRRNDEFETFFLANYDSVVSTLIAITGDRERAVDATQEAFIKASARWSKIRSYELPAAWVRKTAINASRDSWRSDRRRRQRESPLVTNAVPSPAADIVDDAATAALLGCLSRRQREVATLFYVEDRSVSETAGLLGVSEGTVKSQLADARDRMRQHLTAEEARR